MTYPNGEEIKQFDLVAIAYNYRLFFGIVWTSNGPIHFRPLRYEGWLDSFRYDLKLIKKENINKGTRWEGQRTAIKFINTNHNLRVVKIDPSQLPENERKTYDKAMAILKEATG